MEHFPKIPEAEAVPGFVKGYAFIEYENKQEADAAIKDRLSAL